MFRPSPHVRKSCLPARSTFSRFANHPPLVLGTVRATKPAWMIRRQSENDLELLTWLTDGLGALFANSR